MDRKQRVQRCENRHDRDSSVPGSSRISPPERRLAMHKGIALPGNISLECSPFMDCKQRVQRCENGHDRGASVPGSSWKSPPARRLAMHKGIALPGNISLECSPFMDCKQRVQRCETGLDRGSSVPGSSRISPPARRLAMHKGIARPGSISLECGPFMDRKQRVQRCENGHDRGSSVPGSSRISPPARRLAMHKGIALPGKIPMECSPFMDCKQRVQRCDTGHDRGAKFPGSSRISPPARRLAMHKGIALRCVGLK